MTTMTSLRKLRWWQCSLRSLWTLMTMTCVVLSVQQARERYLERSVTSFNALLDEQRYVDAAILAKQAHYWYPSPLTEAMVEKATFACEIAGRTHDP